MKKYILLICVFILSMTGCNLFQSITIEVEDKTIFEETQFYIVEATYPELSYPEGINEIIKGIIDVEIEVFKEQVESDYVEDLEDFENILSGLYISYFVHNLDSDLISIRFKNDIYFQGAAHGYTFTAVLNYDVNNLEELMLEDLFKEDAEYLKKISEFTYKKINENLYEDEFVVDEWLAEGTSPVKENFMNFNIEESALVFTFDPYHVAPYAAGPQEVRMPFEELDGMLKDKYL